MSHHNSDPNLLAIKQYDKILIIKSTHDPKNECAKSVIINYVYDQIRNNCSNVFVMVNKYYSFNMDRYLSNMASYKAITDKIYDINDLGTILRQKIHNSLLIIDNNNFYNASNITKS